MLAPDPRHEGWAHKPLSRFGLAGHHEAWAEELPLVLSLGFGTEKPSIGTLFSGSGIEASLILGESSEAEPKQRLTRCDMVASVAPGLTQFEIRPLSLDCSGVASDCFGRVATLTCPTTGNTRPSLNGEHDHGTAADGREKLLTEAAKRRCRSCCRRPHLDSKHSGKAHKPSHCSDSHDLTKTRRWHLGWRSSGFDSVRLAACPLETFNPVSQASTTTASDGALDGKQKPSTATTRKTTETTSARCAQRAVHTRIGRIQDQANHGKTNRRKWTIRNISGVDCTTRCNTRRSPSNAWLWEELETSSAKFWWQHSGTQLGNDLTKSTETEPFASFLKSGQRLESDL